MALAQKAQKTVGHRCIESQAGRQLHRQAAQVPAQAGGLRQKIVKPFAAPTRRCWWVMVRGSLTEKRKVSGTLAAQRA
jgi:hypothetical protein